MRIASDSALFCDRYSCSCHGAVHDSCIVHNGVQKTFDLEKTDFLVLFFVGTCFMIGVLFPFRSLVIQGWQKSSVHRLVSVKVCYAMEVD